MSKKGGAASTSKDSRGHHADLRNIPTVQLGETLSSLYISEQRIPPRRGEPSGNNPNNVPIATPRAIKGAGDVAGDHGGKDEDGHGDSQRPSIISEDTTKVDSSPGSQTLSMTPSTPPTISSHQSYSNEMNDELTPLREALPPAVSTKRRSILDNDGGGVNRRNRNASSSYAALPTIDIPPRSTATMEMGLSEMLASPDPREGYGSFSPQYGSPFDRTGSGSRALKSPGAEGPQIDYFNLPINHRDGPRSGHSEATYSPEPMMQTGRVTDPTPPLSSEMNVEGSTSTPSWSSSDVTSASQSSGLKSPKIRNEGMLAPHGSFTSASGRQYQARAKLERAQSRRDQDTDSVGSGGSVSSWRSRAASQRSMTGTGRELNEEEYLMNVEAARGGDQLALYHLGWGPTAGPNRHSLGDSDLVWGGVNEPTSPSSFSSRSSATSRPSIRSNSTSGSFPRHLSGRSDQERLRDALHREPTKEERPKLHTRTSSTSDLFADVARMTLQSNADNNKTSKPPVPPSPGRPSMFKSASYVSSSGAGSVTGRPKKPREKKDSDRERDKDIERDGIRGFDPEREKRRAARHAARKEEAASASGSNATTARTRTSRHAISPSVITKTISESDGQETPRPAPMPK